MTHLEEEHVVVVHMRPDATGLGGVADLAVNASHMDTHSTNLRASKMFILRRVASWRVQDLHFCFMEKGRRRGLILTCRRPSNLARR